MFYVTKVNFLPLVAIRLEHLPFPGLGHLLVFTAPRQRRLRNPKYLRIEGRNNRVLFQSGTIEWLMGSILISGDRRCFGRGALKNNRAG